MYNSEPRIGTVHMNIKKISRTTITTVLLTGLLLPANHSNGVEFRLTARGDGNIVEEFRENQGAQMFFAILALSIASELGHAWYKKDSPDWKNALRGPGTYYLCNRLSTIAHEILGHATYALAYGYPIKTIYISPLPEGAGHIWVAQDAIDHRKNHPDFFYQHMVITVTGPLIGMAASALLAYATCKSKHLDVRIMGALASIFSFTDEIFNLVPNSERKDGYKALWYARAWLHPEKFQGTQQQPEKLQASSGLGLLGHLGSILPVSDITHGIFNSVSAWTNGENVPLQAQQSQASRPFNKLDFHYHPDYLRAY